MIQSGHESLLAINRLVTELAQRSAKMEDSRSDRRYSLNEPVSLWVVRPRETTPRLILRAWGLDLSYQGLGIISEKQASVGAMLIACLREKRPDELRVPFQPLFCRALIGNIFRLGGKFLFP
jgi:hypothetical protein